MRIATPPFTGRHVLAELTGVPAVVLDDEPGLCQELTRSLVDAGANVLQVVSHRFSPGGLTVLAVLAESHASVHTWPECGSAFVDVFTCGDAADPELAVTLLAERLGAREVSREQIRRGTEAVPSQVSSEVPSQVTEPMSAGLRRVWDVDEVLWRGRTAYQEVLIGRTAHGITLFCDDERQSSEATQLVYHEALMVPALLLADQVGDVLIIGSSEGVASELAVAAGASRVDHVDIDTECVRACARWLPYGYTPETLAAAERGAGPVRVHYTDGWAFLERAASAGERYDAVVVDLPDERPDDPDAQHNRLYGEQFLKLAGAVLAPGGVLVGQAGCPTLWRNDTLTRSVQRFAAVFPTVLHYGSDEHEWAFLSGTFQPVEDPVERVVNRLAELPYRPVSVDGPALRRGAVLPRAVRRAIVRN